MNKRKPKVPADYIEPLYINGLRGRMLHMPAPKNRNREILFVYGHHASLERYFGFAEALNAYGPVTMPDLPGFGGMESFYKIGMTPTLDNLADYLATFIKLRYKRRRITIIGMSFGFIVATKMLQKYPDLVRKVDLVISVVGFCHKDDFHLKRRYFYTFRYGTVIFSRAIMAWMVQYIFLRPTLIRFAYHLVEDKNEKLREANREERERRIDFEIGLWRSNDVRTYMKTATEMFTLDLCNKQVALSVYHVAVDMDRYFDNGIVEQHMKVIYQDCTLIKAKMNGHSHTVIATAKEVAPFFPRQIRSVLSKS